MKTPQVHPITVILMITAFLASCIAGPIPTKTIKFGVTDAIGDFFSTWWDNFATFFGFKQKQYPAMECKVPYIPEGRHCCLDQDGNNICDRTQARVTTTTLPQKTTTTTITTTTTTRAAPVTSSTTTTISSTTTSTTSTTLPAEAEPEGFSGLLPIPPSIKVTEQSMRVVFNNTHSQPILLNHITIQETMQPRTNFCQLTYPTEDKIEKYDTFAVSASECIRVYKPGRNYRFKVDMYYSLGERKLESKGYINGEFR